MEKKTHDENATSGQMRYCITSRHTSFRHSIYWIWPKQRTPDCGWLPPTVAGVNVSWERGQLKYAYAPICGNTGHTNIEGHVPSNGPDASGHFYRQRYFGTTPVLARFRLDRRLLAQMWEVWRIFSSVWYSAGIDVCRGQALRGLVGTFQWWLGSGI